MFDVNFTPKHMTVEELRDGMYWLAGKLFTDACMMERRRPFFDEPRRQRAEAAEFRRKADVRAYDLATAAAPPTGRQACGSIPRRAPVEVKSHKVKSACAASGIFAFLKAGCAFTADPGLIHHGFADPPIRTICMGPDGVVKI
jgi:hypothetical protein